MSDVDFIDIILASSSRDSSPSTVYPTSPFASSSSWSSTRSFPTSRPRPTCSPSLPQLSDDRGRFDNVPSSHFSDDEDEQEAVGSRSPSRLWTRPAPAPPRRWRPRNSQRSNHIPMVEPERLGLWTVKEEEDGSLMVPVDDQRQRPEPPSRPTSLFSTSSSSTPDLELSEADLFFVPPPPTRPAGTSSRRSTRTPSPLMLLTPGERDSPHHTAAFRRAIEQQATLTLTPLAAPRTPISAQQSREMQRIIDSCPELSPCSTPRSHNSGSPSSVPTPQSSLLPALPILSPEEFAESRLSRCFRSSSNASTISAESAASLGDLVTPVSPSPRALPLPSSSASLSHVFDRFLEECDELPATNESQYVRCASTTKRPLPPSTPRTPPCRPDRPRTPPRRPSAPPKASQASHAMHTPDLDQPPLLVRSRSPLQKAASLQYDSRRRMPLKSSLALQAALGVENGERPDTSTTLHDTKSPRRLPGRPGLPTMWTNRI